MTEKITQKLYNGSISIDFLPNSHTYKKDGERLVSVTSATGMLDKSGPLVYWATNLTRDFLLNLWNEGIVINQEAINEAVRQHSIRKEQAADIGTRIHAWAEAYAKGENPDLPKDDNEDGAKVVSGILAFLKWVDEHGVKFVSAERIIYSKEHTYVGLMDSLFTMNSEGHGVLHVGDYKSANGIYNEMRYQVSGYRGAFEEEMKFTKDGRSIGSSFILRFAKEDKFDKSGNLTQEAGDFEVMELDDLDHQKDFQCFLALLELKKRDKELTK